MVEIRALDLHVRCYFVLNKSCRRDSQLGASCSTFLPEFLSTDLMKTNMNRVPDPVQTFILRPRFVHIQFLMSSECTEGSRTENKTVRRQSIGDWMK
jgi:hypothetical protein